MPKSLTSFDIAAVVAELKTRLAGVRVVNIYQNWRVFTFKLRKPGQPAVAVLLEPGKSLHLTSYVLEKPQTPPAFCMILRRYLRHAVLVEVSQHEFERIVVFTFRTKEGEMKLVAELFGEGNIILVNAQNKILQALTYRRMRDRSILRGELFQHAPSTGMNPFLLERKDLEELKKYGGMEVVRALTKIIGMGGMYAEEALLRARVEKQSECERLNGDELTRIFKAVRALVKPLELGTLDPCIVLDESGRWVDAIPMSLKKYEELDCKRHGSFNEALDEFYSKTRAEQTTETAAGEFEEELARQQRILSGQTQALEKARREAEDMRKAGDTIYAHFHDLQNLAQRILNEKRDHKTWGAIIAAVEAEKEHGRIPSVYFQSLDANSFVLNLSIEGLTVSLRLRRSVQENAATYYERAKKAERKVEGAEKAIRETMKTIEEVQTEKRLAAKRVIKPMKRQGRAWFEKFRWFHTSDGMLVIGGKDAVTNEILVKKHTEPHDLVFHADIEGAPFVTLKTEGAMPAKQSIDEAAQLAASHSRAWKAGFSAVDVYWVRPSQVTKSPPSGEHLSRGAFMIKDKKNYVRKTPLRLAIGVDTKATPSILIGGPEGAVKSRTELYVEIAPGGLSSRELAGKIRQRLNQKASGDLRGQISQISYEEIQAFIPFGKGQLVSE